MKLISTLIVLFGFQSAIAGKKMDCDDMKSFKDISNTEMQKIVSKKSATIIDVNSAKSYKKNHIPGAVHFASAKKNFGAVLPPDKNAPVVAYCGGKLCTAWHSAAKKACEMGYTNIKHFSEGIKGWTQSEAMNKKKG